MHIHHLSIFNSWLFERLSCAQSLLKKCTTTLAGKLSGRYTRKIGCGREVTGQAFLFSFGRVEVLCAALAELPACRYQFFPFVCA